MPSVTTSEADMERQLAEAEAAARGEDVEVPTEKGSFEAMKDEKETKPVFIEVRDQRFQLERELPGLTLLDLAAAGDPEATDFERVKAIRGFLAVAVIEEQQADFHRFLRTARPAIDIPELVEIINQAAEKLGGRPTE